VSLPRVHACHVDAGLVATYSGPRSDTVTVHLRRFGYPPELRRAPVRRRDESWSPGRQAGVDHRHDSPTAVHAPKRRVDASACVRVARIGNPGAPPEYAWPRQRDRVIGASTGALTSGATSTRTLQQSGRCFTRWQLETCRSTTSGRASGRFSHVVPTDPQTETVGRSVGRRRLVATRSTIARATPASGTTASLNPACTTAPGIPHTTLDSSSWAIT